MSIESYYLNQAAGMPSFSGPLVQQGHGIGGIFRSLFRTVVPLFQKAAPVLKSVAKSAAKEAVRTGANVVDDLLDGDNIKDSLSKRGNEAIERSVRKGAKRLRSMMSAPRVKTVHKKRRRLHQDIFSS